jgi:hypothetical protein
MKIPMLLLGACWLAAFAAVAQSPAATSSGPIPIRRIEDSGQTAGAPGEPKYSVDASWVIAGYNDNEVIYSIVITNQDQRIIRCSTQLSGFYLDNGARHAISDRQGVTIFPGKQSSAGRWVGMDQASGATYKVTCRAVS